jgi:hypothetical protein
MGLIIGVDNGSGGAGAGGLDMPTGATLMQTGQTVSYRTGDDADTSSEGRATDFFTLAENNPFGNTDRFTDELGTQTYADDIVIDWSTYNGATVLGWNRNIINSDINWNDAIDDALLTSIGTFTSGWFLPNTSQLFSIVCFGANSAISYAPFNYVPSNLLLTSTTWNLDTTKCFFLSNSQMSMQTTFKTSTTIRRYIACRTFTVTGTTLS